MVAAVFYMDSWLGHEEHYFEGEDASEILSQFERVQDLGCLSRMARVEGTKRDIKEMEKLDKFLDKYYSGELTMEDLAAFKIEISIGKFGVLKIANNDDEIGNLSNYK